MVKNLLIETMLNPSQESLESVNQGLHEFNLPHLRCEKISVII